MKDLEQKLKTAENLIKDIKMDSFREVPSVESVLNDARNREFADVKFEIISTVKTKLQVDRKMSMAMQKAMSFSRNARLNMRAMTEGFESENGDRFKYTEIKPKEVNLPAEISQAVRVAGLSSISWTDLNDLPSMMNEQIKKMGETVFQSFGLNTSGKIHTISSFKNSEMLNSNLELNSVLGFLKNNASQVFEEPLTQIFSGIGGKAEEYKPKIQIYNTNDKAYLVVFEPEGQGMESQYIYEFHRDEKLQNKNKNSLRKIY